MGDRLKKPGGSGAVPASARLSIRIDFGPGLRFGPGKAVLLEAIAREGSISAAARSLDMSYKRAWQLVDDMNAIFGAPLVASQVGGQKGGGASLTSLGESVLQGYRAIERQAGQSAASGMKSLLRLTK